ncbi:MBL fold metallo-hydrolase [Thiothrix lacustris]|uniref:MBL fold metallo-hydrolase n=1 Tax=Thiothrix lacustris TaxID=525917 RepID=UPI000A0516F5|nr:MBL fold metallo-hydrolase [Thiothrix lacustris]
MRAIAAFIAIFCLLLGLNARADDKLPPVVMELIKVSEHVYYVQGAPGAATQNHGFISNAAVIVTDEGVILFDTLGSPALAQLFLQKLKKVTDKPVKKVIVSHYHADHVYGLQVFKDMGAEIIAPAGAEDYLNAENTQTLLEERRTSLAPWVNADTHIVKPDRYVEGNEEINFGGVTLKLIFNGKAHSDGDQSVLVEPDGVLLIGDLIFEGRVPYVGDANTKVWLERLKEMSQSKLTAMIPGHGPMSKKPQEVIKTTAHYIEFLRETMGKAVEDMTPFDEAYEATDWGEFIDMPAFAEANRKNAYQVYLSLEQEGMQPPEAEKVSADTPAAPVLREAPALTEQAKQLLDEVNQRITNVNTPELKALLQKHPETQLIDVRTPQEITLLGGSIDAPRHRNLMRGWLEMHATEQLPDKNIPIVVYCGVNQRSPLAADTLMKLGYTNVKNYADGFFAWKDAGLPVEENDKALDSFLYSKPVEVIPGVWSAIGATAPPSYDNSGHNNNLSFVITDAGVVVMNAGDNYLLAQALHDEIKQRTDQPVKYVLLENGQGHAMLGMNYWQEQGAKVIMHQDAWHEVEQRGADLIALMRARSRDKAYRTELSKPDVILSEDSMDLSLGSWKIQALRIGSAHSPGDIMLWMPDKQLLISGDVAFHERLLPLFEDTDTDAWIDTWAKLEALKPTHIIPGHGSPTNLAEVTQYTKDYLVYLRTKVGEILENGGTLQDAYKIDQSAFAHLDTFDELSLANAGMVFREMEFE